MQQRIEEMLAAAGYQHYETSAFALPNGRGKYANDDETRHARFPLPGPPPQAGEGGNVSPRESLFNCRARHNLNYWQFGDYLGIGAGAHSKLSFPDKIMRQARYKQPQAYMQQVAREAPIQTENEVSRDELGFEFMMNALRLNEGFDSVLFQERTSLPLLTIQRELAEAENRGLLIRTLGHGGAQPAGAGEASGQLHRQAANFAGNMAQLTVHQRIAPTKLGQRFLNDLLEIFLQVLGSLRLGSRNCAHPPA